MIERGILYVVDETTNSMSQHVLILLKYINRARYKPYLLTSSDSYLLEHVRKLNVEYEVIPAIAGANKLNLGGIAKQIDRFIEEHAVNLIHSHGYQACYVSAQVAKNRDIPHISTVHTVDSATSKKKGFLNLPYDKIAAMPDHLIAVSEVVKKDIEGFNSVSLICNAVEADRFGETLDTEHLYRELDLKKANDLVGVITRLSPEKGTGTFLEAAAALVKDNPNMYFIIAGDGDERQALEKKASTLGISQNLRFLGFRRDVAHILKSLGVVVIPNLAAGLPLILLEALACKIPVVVTDVPGVREVVTEDHVEMIPAGSTAAIIEAVSGIRADQRKADAKAQAGYKVVTEKFTIPSMIKPTESLYLEKAR
ncbi:MAG: glycosyltransferase family 4 protein [Candidatus Aquicultor sp.]